MSTTPSRIRVFIVDDSAVVRQALTALLDGLPGIEVIGVAQDPIFAEEKMARAWPDVIILDIEMPRMDGISFLKKIMNERPTPVVICSSLAERGAETTFQALSAGAVSVITKPKLGVGEFLRHARDEIVAAIREAQQANLNRLREHAKLAYPVTPAKGPVAHTAPTALAATTEQIVAIGTSTGGTQALEHVLTALPRVCPGLVMVQHMPEKFTAMFASRLNSICAVEVREARNGDRVGPSLALLAPGGKHMRVRRSGAQYHVEVFDGPPVNRHRPSVDVLFRSVAQSAGRNALGIIMTGMGADGAFGLKEMHDAGASTIAQDEATCIVYGMPKEAVRLGAVDRQLPLGSIAAAILGVSSA
jgi:two-component system chemotaxis response regulator CheB